MGNDHGVQEMNWSGTQLGNIQADRYATSHDFCRVFRDSLDSLYLLSLLLTGDQNKAEHCFAAGFEGSIQAKQVFKESAFRWATVAIIRNAIAELQPCPGWVGSALSEDIAAEDSALSALRAFELYRVLALPDFLRFVFVLSVLEQYSKHDCSLLLGCSIEEIEQARLRALELIANTAQSAPGCEGTLADVQVVRT